MRELLARPELREVAVVVADRTDMLLAILDGRTIRWRSDTGARHMLGCPGGLVDLPVTGILSPVDLHRITAAAATDPNDPCFVHARRWDRGDPVPLRIIAWPVDDLIAVIAIADR